MKEVAIFLPNWVGDAVMATPLLRALREGLDQRVRLVGVCKPVIGALLQGTQWFSKYLFIPPVNDTGILGRFEIVRRLRIASFDTAILLPNSFESAFIARLSGFKKIVGYGRDGRSFLLTHPLVAPRDGRKWQAISPVDYYLRIADYMDCDSGDRRMELGLTPMDLFLYRKFWLRTGFSADRHTIVINNSGAFGGSKHWPDRYVLDLALVLANSDCQVILHCGPDERVASNAIACKLNSPKIQSMGIMDYLPIGLSKSVLANASLVVTTDSGPRHIALAFNKPVVTLFGPTDYQWTRTYNVSESVLAEELPCRACWKRQCPLGHHNCMVNLSVEKVFAEVRNRIMEFDTYYPRGSSHL